MKCRFLDIASQRTYSGDSPYIFYMSDDGCSTGKWYSKTLLVVTDQEVLKISTPSDGLFHLVDLSKSDHPIDLQNHRYIDLSKIICDTLETTGEVVSTSHGDLYLHQFQLVFMSDSEGEFHDSFTVSAYVDGEYEDSVYEIAADTYMEDERLSIDLANEGIEIPEAFQRAVYPTNVRDESSDKILLNRKWKELLIEYWNIAANKGSYKSLINSLKFFEYSDLVRIEEYWKQTDNFYIEELIGRDIEQILDPLIREYLDVMSKTTYIGLYLTIDGLTKNSEGDVEYLPQLDGSQLDKFIAEPVPVLEEVALKFSVNDLAMKMTLLGNYFSTYFMPIHLDLMHSCIDRVVFTNTVKILRGIRRRREDWFDSLSPIACSLSTDNQYWMGNAKAFNYPDTVLRNSGVPTYWGDLNVVGVDPTVENRVTFSEENQAEVEKYLNQYFGGVGVIVPVSCVFNSVRNFLKSIRLSIYRQIDGSNYALEVTYLSETSWYSDSLDFNLLFTKSGHYCVMLQATQADGTDFTGSWYLDVFGTIGNAISVKRLKKIDYRADQELYDDWFYKNLSFNDFMFTEGMDEQLKYKQWLVPTSGTDPSGIGLNHLVVIDCGATGIEREITLTCGNSTKTFSFSIGNDPEHPEIIQELQEEYKHYWWKLLVRTQLNRTPDGIVSGSDRYYIVGVRKAFDTDEEIDRELFSDYYKIYKDGELEELEVVNVRYVTSHNPRNRGYLIVTAPIGSELRLDHTSPTKTVGDTTTIPLYRETSTLHLKYVSGGHLFTTDVEIPDTFSIYGQESYKIRPQKAAGYTTIDTSRFFPIFHTLEDVDPLNVKRTETIVCLPNFRWIDECVSEARWLFTNRTTGEEIHSKGFLSGNLYIEQPFVGHYDYSDSLSKGYYDVTLEYRIGGTWNQETVESAFRML